MSNTYFLALFLCCLAHLISTACNARHIIDVTQKEPGKDFHFISNKENEKSSAVGVSSSVLLKKSELAAKNGSSLLAENAAVGGKNNHQSRRARKAVSSKHDEVVKSDESGAKVLGDEQIESLERVSWKLPKKKRGEQQPGFNLDYVPPKTHPPAHN